MLRTITQINRIRLPKIFSRHLNFVFRFDWVDLNFVNYTKNVRYDLFPIKQFYINYT